MLSETAITQMQQERTERARAGLAKGDFKFSAAGQGWRMVNGDGKEFSVSLTTCTCQDFADRGPKLGLRCKHIEAARILFPASPDGQPVHTQTPEKSIPTQAPDKNIPAQGGNTMYLGNLPIIGHLGRDPEMRFTPSGKPVTNFSVAVNRQYTGGNGETVKETYWFKCTAWDKQAEICNQYLQKGRAVFVEGILQSRSWETGDGQKRSTIDVRAERIQFLGGGSKAEGSPAGQELTAKDAADQDTVISPEDIAWEE